jgi:RNA polymerase sigma factor (sigma-70 family)
LFSAATTSPLTDDRLGCRTNGQPPRIVPPELKIRTNPALPFTDLRCEIANQSERRSNGLRTSFTTACASPNSAPPRRFTDVTEVMDREEFSSLLEAVAVHRDQGAFVKLYDYFGPRIYALLLRLRLQPMIAQDLTQEVLWKLWHRANLFDRTRSSVAAWLFQIARNARTDYVRSQRGEVPIGEEARSVHDPGQSSDDAPNASQWEGRVRASLADLPDEQLAVIKLAFFEDLSHAEITKQSGLPLGKVKARIGLALARLRRGLG